MFNKLNFSFMETVVVIAFVAFIALVGVVYFTFFEKKAEKSN